LTSVVPTRNGLFVATGSLYRRVANRWQRVLAAHPAPSTAPEFATALLAVSRDEAWVAGFDAAGANAVWHAVWHAGAWSGVPVPTGGDAAQQLLRTPDGSLWTTDDRHAASVLRGSTWTSVGVWADGLALDRHGRVWVADGTGSPMSVRAYALDHGRWVERNRTSPTELVAGPVHIGVGHDGTIWVVGTWTASGALGSGLARYAGGAWAMVDPLGGHGNGAVADLVVAPNGDVWVAGTEYPGAETAPQDWLARFDGTKWAIFRPADALGLMTVELPGWHMPAYNALAVGPDGAVWVAGMSGLFRYYGRTWTALYPGIRFSDISVAGDGTVWVIGPSGVARLGPDRTSR
jgi:ligand-binding sensor domain-containing protein